MESLIRVTPGEAFNARQFYGAYSLIPDWVARMPVSGNAKVIYARLLRYAQTSGRAFPSYETLGKYVGLSERQAQRLCHELRDAGVVKIHRRRRSDTNQNQTSVFEFLYQPEMDAVAPDEPTEEYEAEPTDTCDVKPTEPVDTCGTEPTDTYGTDPTDMDVRVRDKQRRDKRTRDKQAERSAAAAQDSSNQKSQTKTLTRESVEYKTTLKSLRAKGFSDARLGQKWEMWARDSGFSDQQLAATLQDPGFDPGDARFPPGFIIRATDSLKGAGAAAVADPVDEEGLPAHGTSDRNIRDGHLPPVATIRAGHHCDRLDCRDEFHALVNDGHGDRIFCPRCERGQLPSDLPLKYDRLVELRSQGVAFCDLKTAYQSCLKAVTA